MSLKAGINKEVKDLYEQLSESNQLLPEEQLKASYGTFRNRFGPDRLMSLEGQELLEAVHDNSNENSLLYWLEFKNDDEFATAKFGSIRGGSALKFGVFRSADTGAWMGKGSGGKPTQISFEMVVQLATGYRDQLLEGAELLEKLPEGADSADYARLQSDMDKRAPDVSRLSWGHKYFSLLYPDKLDDYHNPHYQRFHLLKLLQLPPDGDGRYVSAIHYVTIAGELGVPLANLTRTLNRRHGEPHRYWRVGTSNGEQPRNRWELMRDGDCVAIGWRELGDLTPLMYGQDARERIKQLISDRYPDTPQQVGKESRQVFRFVREMQGDDLVLAADGGRILGVGRVVGEYSFDPTSDFPHRCPVEWISLDEWKLPLPSEGQQTAVHEMRSRENLLETETRVFNVGDSPIDHKGRKEGPPRRTPLNVILFGPPGTGKTYTVQRKAVEIVEPSAVNLSDEEIGEKFQSYRKDGRIEFVTFHPSFSYEEFVEGFRYDEEKGLPTRHDGVFKKMCELALKPQPRKEVWKEARIWKVSINRWSQYEFFKQCLENNRIAIGFLNESIEGCDKENIHRLLRESGVSQNESIVRSLDYFANEMRSGDYVVAFEHAGAISAIGVVDSDYRYEEDEEFGNSHVRDVKWLDKRIHDILELNGGKSLNGPAVYPLQRIKFQDFVKLLPEKEKREEPFVLIVDEINRGNISRIFGELITLLETDKRLGAPNELSVKLPYSQEDFSVPGNLHVIGTMNTADRSIALLDVALRRRFEFEEMMPDVEVLREHEISETICKVFEILNARISALLDRDHQIGHSYFLAATSPEDLHHALYKRVFPLLQEYFYNDPDQLTKLLGEYEDGESRGFVKKLTLNFGRSFTDDRNFDTLWEFHVYGKTEIEEALRRTFIEG